MKKKILLLFALLLGSMSAWAAVGDTFTAEYDGTTLKYKVLTEEEGNYTCEVTQDDSYTNLTEVKIPSSVSDGSNNYNVTSIGKNSFMDCSSLTSVELPNTTTSILSGAFCRCYDLSSINLPEGLTSIEGAAFQQCSNLTSIILPEGLTSVTNSMFVDCSSLTSINIPSSVTSIGKSAFNGCSSLTSIIIPSSVSSIKSLAFNKCSSLTSITFEGTPTLDNTSLGNKGPNVNLTVNVTNYDPTFISKLQNMGVSTTNIAYSLDSDHDYTLTTATNEVKISFTREFTKDCWQPLFLPFSLSATEWSAVGEVAKLTGYADDVLTWTKLGESEATVAGTPYIIKPSSAGVTLTVNAQKDLAANTTINEVEVGQEGNKVTLSGTYTEKTMSDGNFWGLSDGDFYYTNDPDKKLKPYRIFLTAPKPASSSPAPIRNRIVEEGATEIEAIEAAAPAAQAYSLQGIRVDEGYKGIVIVNGKKFIRK